VKLPVPAPWEPSDAVSFGQFVDIVRKNAPEA
jgi:hypothetical protein